MSFNWNNGPLEFVDGATVTKNVTFAHDIRYDTTDIFDSDGNKLATVWTKSGDTNNSPNYQGYRYIRAVKESKENMMYGEVTLKPVLSMDDADIAKELRTLDKRYDELFNELVNRGYDIVSKNNNSLHTDPIARIYKNTVTEL